MKHHFHFATLLFVAISMTISVNILSSCGKNANASKEQDSTTENGTEATNETAAQEADDSMKAPQIELDESGVISLSKCPTEYDKLEVAVSEDKTKVTISYDGQQIQTLSDPDDGLVATGDDAPIYFMDANFDGHVDIFIGPGESRTYSTLLVWNATAKQFKRIGSLGNPSLQNFMLYPTEKSVYEGGSASWCADYFTRSIWENGNLKTVEELSIVNDPEQYGEYDVEKKYTVKDDQQKVTLSTDDLSSLPVHWKNVLDNYGPYMP